MEAGGRGRDSGHQWWMRAIAGDSEGRGAAPLTICCLIQVFLDRVLEYANSTVNISEWYMALKEKKNGKKD